MNRIMVCLGFGSLPLFAIAALLFTSSQTARADFPAYQAPSYPTSIHTMPPEQFSQPITWYTDLQSGWLESKRLGLPMVIFITSDRCVYCDAMKRDTWCNSDIQNSLSGDFIAIRLTPKTNHETLSRIKIPAFPTTLLGSPSGKVIAHRVGYQPPRAMRGLLAEADQYEVR